MQILMFISSFFLGMVFGSLIQKHLLGPLTYFKFIENKNKKPREDDDYYLLQDGGASYLFTDTEVVRALERANKHPEDID